MKPRTALFLLLAGVTGGIALERWHRRQKLIQAVKRIVRETPTSQAEQEWDAGDIQQHRSETSGMLCADYAVTWAVPTGSDIPQFVDRDLPAS